MTLSLMFPLNHTEEPNPEAYGNYTHLHLSAHTYCTHTLSHCLCSHRFTKGVRKLQFGESARAFLASFYNTSSPMVGMTICLRVVSSVGVSACACLRTCRGAPRHPVMCDFFFPPVFACACSSREKGCWWRTCVKCRKITTETDLSLMITSENFTKNLVLQNLLFLRSISSITEQLTLLWDFHTGYRMSPFNNYPSINQTACFA